MKKIYKALLVVAIATSSGGGVAIFGQTLGAVTLASYSEEEENNAGAATTEFLNNCVVSLSKNLNAWSIVLKKSSSSSLKAFASKMMDDDEVLLKQARVLAAKLEVSVPYSSELKDEFKSFENDQADVDAEFADIAIRILERTMESFRAGAECDDRWVRAFAASHLSTIENHLIELRSITRKSH